MFSILKKILFWNYTRTTWQYDVLCVLILAFVFLTPKSWFANQEFRKSQYRVLQTLNVEGKTRLWLLAAPSDKTAEPTRDEVEHRVRVATGNERMSVKEFHAVRGKDGEITAFEVDTE